MRIRCAECEQLFTPNKRGRPPRFCSQKCRYRNKDRRRYAQHRDEILAKAAARRRAAGIEPRSPKWYQRQWEDE